MVRASIQVQTTCVGYIRVSTEEQRSGVSLEAQESRIRSYCDARELELVEVVSDVASGKNLKRPGVQDLIGRCERGDVGHVVVLKLDRLTRRTRHLLELVEDTFLGHHIELHSVEESIDSSTPNGKFVLTLFGSLAQMEREVTSQRTRQALAHKREQGQPTSHPPYGFKPNGKRRRMVPVTEELEVVDRILAMWRSGTPSRKIAAVLNAEGVPAKRGGAWVHTSVVSIINHRERYAAA